ncbi:LysR family transcriptional regulator [Luteolibacter yonseiensis]|uniref:LysR family transcriptional regulator n=1 Tax=Luteolibacter yonseiensis TaxID=1144680 RepID=A0A934VCC0_9BACT|nr:LysR family transcriptional regulator [Luteolibacter yonseiensis]MBK1816816.1 LysR family transcriptional regulator [Luteolibacter yonseiensis]
MELRQLKHFVAVGETGSITAAAKKLRLTQPALSRQIKSLEEELDTALLERGAHSIQLTPAGEILLAEARKLVKFSDAMIEKVKSSTVGEPLRVGYAPSLAGEFLSVAIERFTQFHPRVRVSLYDWSSAEMRAGLENGKLDLILAAPCVGLLEPIKWISLRSYGWQLAMSANHALAGKQRITAGDLDGQKLLLYDREHYPDYWDRITGFFKEHQIQAKIAGEFDGVSSLTAALEGNLGIALLAESSRIDPRQRLITRPLDAEPSRIDVAAGLPADNRTSAQVLAFVEELKHAAADLSRHSAAPESSP